MDDEPEVIRQQMDETRTALADKLGRLEQQVTETVHGAVESVTNAKNAATETVENVRSAVEETVESVRQSVKNTVDSVTETLDVEVQVQRHPWTMVWGAAAVGFVGGYLCYSGEQQRKPSSREASRSRQLYASHESQREEETPRLAADRREREAVARPPAFNWLASQTHSLQPALDQLKGLAVGTLFGVAKDLLTRSLPQPMEGQINEVVDGLTIALGGKPIRGHVLSERPPQAGRAQAPASYSPLPSSAT